MVWTQIEDQKEPHYSKLKGCNCNFTNAKVTRGRPAKMWSAVMEKDMLECRVTDDGFKLGQKET